jgi:hypothetical protein
MSLVAGAHEMGQQPTKLACTTKVEKTEQQPRKWAASHHEVILKMEKLKHLGKIG